MSGSGGDPSAAIIELAESDKIDLVVDDFPRPHRLCLVYGSVAEKVLHNARCPLMFVRTLESEGL